MVSFLHKFRQAAARRGIEITQSLADTPYAAVLVIGGTREVLSLKRVQQRGVRVVQRLDGINWIHRRNPISISHSLRAEYGNLILAAVRRYVADAIIYQSAFAQKWWDDWYGDAGKPARVVHNAVDLEQYSPNGPEQPPADVFRLLVVEGSLGGGYEGGLANAIRLAEAANGLAARPVELVVVGEVSEPLKAEWQAHSRVNIQWAGLVNREQVPGLQRGAHALFSADVHPACPNSVIEALACGLPVVSYDTGSLAELVTAEAGFIAPYGSDPWKLQQPIAAPLAAGLVKVFENQPAYRAGARARAGQAFNIQNMTDHYLSVLLGEHLP
jgi:glycosyltransferase involved in cell wall biosynthesis